MSTSIVESPAPTAAPTVCTTCDAETDTWFLATTTFSWTSASWVLSATQPVCTWEGHCLGDKCKIDDGCDRDWECQQGICQPCCSPAAESSQASSSGLDTSAKVGIGVAVPATVAVLAGVGYLLWRARRKRRRDFYRRQSEGADESARPELEGSSIALDERAKRVEMDVDVPAKRAELPDHNEIAVEADTNHPIELEDTSKPPQKYEFVRVSEPAPAPESTTTAQEKVEQTHEAVDMYRPPMATGVIPSPTPTTVASPPSTRPTPSPAPEWPQSPRPADSTASPQSSNFNISPESSYGSNIRESPVSTITSPRGTHRQGQRSPPPVFSPGLPPGMIDRFDEEDDEDDDQRSARQLPSQQTSSGNTQRAPAGSYTERSDQDLFMFGWPSPPESPVTDDRRAG